jgi:holliday junction DNA helicase RuvB
VNAAAHLRVVRTDASPAKQEDPALRPTSFNNYVGQTEVVETLHGAVRAAKRGGWQLDHVLLAGPPGTGKTSLAQILANELGVKLHATSAPAIEHKGALASLLTVLGEGDVLFIDEIHALDRKIAEVLYTALEDRVLDMPAGKRVIRVPLRRFTLVGATTHAGKLPAPLRDRFGLHCQLRGYDERELATIVARSACLLGVAIDDGGALVIARASRGTPRVANRLLRRVRDVAANAAADGALVVHGDRVDINGPLAIAALDALGLDALGLDSLDRRYLAVVSGRSIGIGVEAICAELGEDRSTIEEAVEPWLLKAGLIQRSSKGRLATEAGREYLAIVEVQ